jgi:hypothetical protein
MAIKKVTVILSAFNATELLTMRIVPQLPGAVVGRPGPFAVSVEQKGPLRLTVVVAWTTTGGACVVACTTTSVDCTTTGVWTTAWIVKVLTDGTTPEHCAPEGQQPSKPLADVWHV